MKRCSQCRVDKPHGEYWRHARRSDGLRSACKDCLKRKAKDWRAAHKVQNAARHAAYHSANPHVSQRATRKRHLKGKAKLNALKDHPCVDCGLEYHPDVMDFDHVRDDKRWQIGFAKMDSPDLADELAKCELRCANCHRLRHTALREGAAFDGDRYPPGGRRG